MEGEFRSESEVIPNIPVRRNRNGRMDLPFEFQPKFPESLAQW